jgi:hypothetical protein
MTLTNPQNLNDTTTINLTLTVNGGTGTGGALPVSPTALAFTASPGGAAQSQNLTVTPPGNALVQANILSYNGPFFSVSSPSCSGTPNSAFNCVFTGSQTLVITVNPGSLTALGTYNGAIVFQSGGATATVSATLNLTAPVTTLTATPAAMSFTATAGGPAQTQSLSVSVPGSAQVQASLTSYNGNFFSVTSAACNANPTTNTTCTFNGSQTLNVTVNPVNLTNAGTYNGAIQLQSGGVTVNVTVTLTLGSSGTGGGSTSAIAAPPALTFFYQTNSPGIVPQQVISVGAVGAFTAAASVSGAQQWLAASAVGITGPGFVVVSVIPQGLALGTYPGTVTVTSASGTMAIPVILTVTASVVVEANPGVISFNFATGSAPVQLPVLLSASDNSATPVAVSTPTPWITVGAPTATTTPASFPLTLNPSGLCNGLNTGSVTVSAPNAADNGFAVPVVAMVSGSTTTNCSGSGGGPLILGTSSLTFNAPANGPSPVSQSLLVIAPSPSTTYTVSASVQGGQPNWLSVQPSGVLTGTQTLLISVNVAGLASGTYNGTISLNTNGVLQTVPVTLIVGAAGGGGLVANPSALTFTAASGQSAGSQNVTLSTTSSAAITILGVSTDSPNFLSAAVTGGSFTVSSTSPATLTVTATATGLPIGPFVGHITVATSTGVTTITVTLNVVSGSTTGTIVANPASLMFLAPSGQTAAVQTVSLTSGSAVSILGIVPDVSWLSISVSSLTVPATLSVAASAASLSNGFYVGHLTINPSSGSPTVIMVTFLVQPANGGGGGTITAIPSSLQFAYPSANSTSALVAIGSGNPSVTTFNANVTSQSNWLLFANSPSGTYLGLQFGSFLLRVDPSVVSTLAPGSYSGAVTLTNPFNSSDTTTISLTLMVTGGTNLAQGKAATQSSTLPGYLTSGASAAVDGNTDGSFFDGSVTATNLDPNPWWQVDLGASAAVSSVVIWNRTDCCGSRLNDYWVFISDTPFLPTDTPSTLQGRPGTFSSHQTTAPTPSTTIAAGAEGRYVRVQLTSANYLSLAEVQVFGMLAPAISNLAIGKLATQSSSFAGYPTAVAASAVDGNTDGSFFDGSVTATNLDPNAWWQVDLGASSIVSSIVVWNRTDCCSSRLSDYWVFVSDTPFLPTDTPFTLQNRAGTFSSHQTTAPSLSTTIAPVAQGRYVRVQLTGANYLSLAEVQVFGIPAASTSDLALGKTASQSSTLPGYPIPSPGAAVDGNTDGSYFDGSVTATNLDQNAWWQVDLGASVNVSSVVIFNRTDCCGNRLNDFWVFISNTPFLITDTPSTLAFRAGTFSSHQTTAPSPSATIPAGAQGRYVRVQLTGANYLSLAEVQVFGQ